LIKVNWEAEIKEQQELKSTVKLALTKRIWEDGKEKLQKNKINGFLKQFYSTLSNVTVLIDFCVFSNIRTYRSGSK